MTIDIDNLLKIKHQKEAEIIDRESLKLDESLATDVVVEAFLDRNECSLYVEKKEMNGRMINELIQKYRIKNRNYEVVLINDSVETYQLKFLKKNE